MGFFYTAEKPQRLTQRGPTSVALLHKAECSACPLNHAVNLRHPKMKPYGVTSPDIYILGEAPGEVEDKIGKPFVGKAGRTLRMRLPSELDGRLRWGNVIRTHPPQNRDPTPTEIECCRPSVVRDIEASKPQAIFGFGNVPLHWALNQTGITKWAGRRIPVQIGTHRCWFFPLLHPSAVMRSRRFEPSGPEEYGSEVEFAFALDLKRAIAEVNDGLPEPIIHTREDAFDGIEVITGDEPGALERVADYLDAFADDPTVGIDYETNALRPYHNHSKILSVALSSSKHSVGIALHHPQAGWNQAELGKLFTMFTNFLMHAKCKKISHQLNFEMEWSAYTFGKDVLRAGPWEDTVSQAYVLDERMKMGKPDAHSLEFLTLQYFGLNIKSLNVVDAIDLERAPLRDVLEYNALDAKYHRLLHLVQAKRLKSEKLWEVYKSHLERVPTMVLTQLKGLPVDQKAVQKFKKGYEKILAEVEEEIAALPIAHKFKTIEGHAYRPSAEQDVKKLVRNLLRLPLEKADEKALLHIDHEIIDLTLEWRKANKLLSTYVNPLLPESANVYPDGMLHTIISTTRTKTSRTASEAINTQNYPKRKNKEVRSQIRGTRNQRIVSFDLGQIQARNVAMESKDRALVQAFWDRYDIHTAWMERTVQLFPDWVPGGGKALAKDKSLQKAFRGRAKNEFVFPSFFGAQPKSLAGFLGVPERVAEQMHEEFWEEFPDIKRWHGKLQRQYKRYGYVSGLSGYRRRAPVSPNELINAPIQADEALLVCDAMTRLSKLGDDRLQASMEIHDDLTFIWDKHEVDELAPIVIREMLRTTYKWINVPILVEMAIGEDWAKLEDVGAYASDTWDGKIPRYSKTDPDPNTGSWSDGTGWESSKGKK